MPPSVQCSCVDGSGAKVSPCFPRALAQVVEDDARLHHRSTGRRIEGHDLVQVLGAVDDDGDVAALPGQAGAAAARQERRPKSPALFDGGDDVVDGARDDDADGNLAVVRAVGGVERPVTRVEADLAADSRAQGGFEGDCVDILRRPRPG